MPSETCWCGHTLEEHREPLNFCVAKEKINVALDDEPAEFEEFLCPCSMFLPAHDVEGLDVEDLPEAI